VLGELDLATTESGQAEVSDLELLGGSTHGDGVEKKGIGDGVGERCEGERKEGEQSVRLCKVLAEAANKKWPHPSLNLDNCRKVDRSSPPPIFLPPSFQKGL
jgi:hypothetical protein